MDTSDALAPPPPTAAPAADHPAPADPTKTMLAAAIALAVVLLPLAVPLLVPLAVRLVCAPFGWHLRSKTADRRASLVAMMDEEDREARRRAGEKVGEEGWDGVVGFFHPFCNAGGGGERVLWAAIKATQERWPRAKCVVYTGDHDANKAQILGQVKTRFNIDLYAPTITFLYLTSRHLVLAATWPRFTLAGQSLGSLVVAWDALQILVPDIFIDTMGYAFSLGLVKALFGASLPTAAYVHYPTISTDMIASLDPRSAVGAQGVNAGQGVGLRGVFKAVYWRLFATAYSAVGATIDVVMANSSWTQAHVVALWGRRRKASGKPHAEIEVVFPPCAVAETERDVEVSEASEARREKLLLVIAQFRPEKNHRLVVEAFAAFLKQAPADATRGATLALVGSVRNDHDSKRVYQLRLLVNELGIRDRVEFHLDAPWLEVVGLLRRASVGVNGMWNEHFGIGVVEYQAAGLISVVHDSGGPKLDIVAEVDGGATGFHATTVDGFAAAFEKALTLPDPLAVRRRARVSARRFTEEEFARKWLVQMERLVALAGGAAGQ